MFGWQDSTYPKRWKEMSLDFKLIWLYHACMILLFIGGGRLPLQFQIASAGLLVAIFLTLSTIHRRRHHWRWPCIRIKNVLLAVVTLGLGAFFLSASVPMFPPLSSRAFPWYAAGGGIVLFSVLYWLRLVCLSRVDFLKYCGDSGEPKEHAPVPQEPRWKMILRTAFFIYFLAVWLVSVGHFWQFSRAFRDGTAQPTPQRTATISDHGKKVYVTPEEERTLAVLGHCMMVGIPSALLMVPILHFILGVKVIPNVPSYSVIRRKTDAGAASGQDPRHP